MYYLYLKTIQHDSLNLRFLQQLRSRHVCKSALRSASAKGRVRAALTNNLIRINRKNSISQRQSFAKELRANTSPSLGDAEYR